jgi:hypothetical protein
MRKKIVFASFVSVFIAICIYWFFYTREARTPVTEGINAIPTNAALIFESKQSKNTWKKLSQTNIMWEELLGTNTFAKLHLQASYIDSLLELNPAISQLLDDHSVFISAHPSPKDHFSFLFVYSLPNRTYQAELEDFFTRLNTEREIAYTSFENERTGTLRAADKGPLFFSFVEGTLILSADQDLLQESIHQLHSGISSAKDKNFSKVLNTAGKKVDANLYINYKNFPQLLQHFILPAYGKEASSFADFAAYSGWDITVKPNSLMLSGFTVADDSLKKSYLGIFNNQKPQHIELTKIIPQKTALMIFYGISNMKNFRSDYQNYLKTTGRLSAYIQFTQDINTAYHLDIEKAMTEWIDNEMALVVTEPDSEDFGNSSFAVMHTNNMEAALNNLSAITDSVKHFEKGKTDTSGYRGHTIRTLGIPHVLPRLFGWQFEKIDSSFFTAINDYIIFGNSKEALRMFIDAAENNRTLGSNKNYTAFAENISSEANMYIYSSIGRSTPIYKTFLNPEFSAGINKHEELFRKFEAAGIQFSVNNKLYYSNVFLKYNPEYKQEAGTLWESKLDSTLSNKPFLLINHNTKASEVLVQDDANKIYLISNTGKIIWTKQLHEKIMSDVFQLDVLKNNKLQMIFNTRSAIYMFDRNGNDMKGFPVALKSPATNSISVIDYEKNRDYRIFIACENLKVLCFNANGEAVDGFDFDRTVNPVYSPLQYFRTANKDHLCLLDAKGKIYILDRHGEIRVKMKEQLGAGIRSYCFESGKDYIKSYLIAADTLGNVMKVNLAGDIEKIKFQDFETSPYFEYRDINNDKTKEYIFLTRRELKVFNADKTLLFNYDFGADISQAPQIFQFPDGSCKIGVTSELTQELFLFNENGSLFNGFPLKGKTSFGIADMNNEGNINLVTGSADNSIYVYQLR